jgi:tripartite-type tricarboxylate transporter receptor subunit TctC
MTGNSYVINPSFFDKVPYDPYKSFEPVMLAVATPTMLTVNSSVPAKTVKELIALIRANPGKSPRRTSARRMERVQSGQRGLEHSRG